MSPSARVGTGAGNGTTENPNRELDLTETSHWGYDGPLLPPSPPAPPPASCLTPSGKSLLDPRLCTGNSQFTLQIWDKAPDNLHRYSLNTGVKTITLVMQWHGANQPVSFAQYDGSYTLETLPATANNQWTTVDADNPFIPATACERFHLNFLDGQLPRRRQRVQPTAERASPGDGRHQFRVQTIPLTMGGIPRRMATGGIRNRCRRPKDAI